uniref:Secreted protein n=1 Tax=Opuntia streptacantha TaxID=393608 RepID=A0A7C9ERH2_OPUST
MFCDRSWILILSKASVWLNQVLLYRCITTDSQTLNKQSQFSRYIFPAPQSLKNSLRLLHSTFANKPTRGLRQEEYSQCKIYDRWNNKNPKHQSPAGGIP